MGTGSHTGIPGFASASERLAEAYRFARDAHEGPRRRGGTTIAHPEEVARMLNEAGYSEDVIAAALLHDVVEDTDTDVSELSQRFGPEVGSLVAQLTEDPGIPGYDDRKRDLRRRAASDGHNAAAIFTADKLASARHLNEEHELPAEERLDHFERTVRVVRRHHPEVPFLDWLEDEIATLRARAR